MLKTILQVSLVVALASGQGKEEDSKEAGLCMSEEEVVYWCTAGTPLGDKLGAAMESCSETEEPAGRKGKGRGKGKGKGKGRKGPFKLTSLKLITRKRKGKEVSEG